MSKKFNILMCCLYEIEGTLMSIDEKLEKLTKGNDNGKRAKHNRA